MQRSPTSLRRSALITAQPLALFAAKNFCPLLQRFFADATVKLALMFGFFAVCHVPQRTRDNVLVEAIFFAFFAANPGASLAHYIKRPFFRVLWPLFTDFAFTELIALLDFSLCTAVVPWTGDNPLFGACRRKTLHAIIGCVGKH